MVRQSQETADKANTRQGALVVAIRRMLDEPAPTDEQRETTGEEWVGQRQPSPAYAGQTLTSFDEDDLPDTDTGTTQSRRERLVEEYGSREVDLPQLGPTELPQEIGEWVLNEAPEWTSSWNNNRSWIFHYVANPRGDNPQRALVAETPGYSSNEYTAHVEQGEINRSFMSKDDAIIAHEDMETFVDRLLGHLERTPPDELDHPRWDDNLVDAMPDNWQLDYFTISQRKNTIVWERTEPTKTGDNWSIAVVGHPTSKNYTATFKPRSGDASRSNSYQFEDAGVRLPPNPSMWAIGDRAGKVAEAIERNPTDPTMASAVPQDIQVDKPEQLSPDEVESWIKQTTENLRSAASRGRIPSPTMFMNELEPALDAIDRLDKRAYQTGDGLDLRQATARLKERVIGGLKLQRALLSNTTIEALEDALNEVALMMNRRNQHPREGLDDVRNYVEQIRDQAQGNADFADDTAGEVVVGNARLEVPNPGQSGWDQIIFTSPRGVGGDAATGTHAVYLSADRRHSVVVGGTQVGNKWNVKAYEHVQYVPKTTDHMELIYGPGGADSNSRVWRITHGNVVDASADRRLREALPTLAEVSDHFADS